MVDEGSAQAVAGGILDARGNRYHFEFQAAEANRNYRFEEALRELGFYTEAAPRHLSDLADASRVARLDIFGPQAWRRLFRQNAAIFRLARRVSPALDSLAAEFPDFFSPMDV